MPFPQQLLRLLSAPLLVFCLVCAISFSIEAKGKKSRRSTAQSKRNTSSQVKSSRRQVARRGKKSSQRAIENDLAFEPNPINSNAPDSIEVIEYGSTNSTDLSRLTNLPMPRTTVSTSADTVDLTSPPRRRNVRMDSSRVIEIQQALTQKGFFKGEITGVYDTETINAMRYFQASEKISVTGYPTAHALKRLGLAN